jgi:UDPglucose 6-dehydrogenase
LRTEVGKVSRVAIIGLGYVGLTTALGLAKLGHDVIGVETNEARLLTLKQGTLPIFEPGLDLELVDSLRTGRLTLTGNLGDATDKANFFFICVSTPQSDSGEADLTFVRAVYKDLVGAINPESTIVLKSTVPVGTGDELTRTMSRTDIFYASNPEFLREGTALIDFMKPDRILVGADSAEVGAKVMDLYNVIDAPKIVTSVKSAELIKYAANAYLASRLSFVNDLAALCEQVGANIDDVVVGMGSDLRIGSSFLSPGPGWGGSCFPKDTRALVAVARDNQVELRIVESAIEANENAFDRVVSRLARLLGGDLNGKVIAVLGLAFKANTDDTRDSPALEVINRLIIAGSTVRAFDPIASAPADASFTQSSTVLEAVSQANALLVLTEWDEFREIDPKAVAEAMKGSVVLDTRRVLPAESWKSAFNSFNVLGVGDK